MEVLHERRPKEDKSLRFPPKCFGQNWGCEEKEPAASGHSGQFSVFVHAYLWTFLIMCTLFHVMLKFYGDGTSFYFSGLLDSREYSSHLSHSLYTTHVEVLDQARLIFLQPSSYCLLGNISVASSVP